jgi:hypothetical protein
MALTAVVGCSSPGPGELLPDTTSAAYAVADGDTLYANSLGGIVAIPLKGGAPIILAPSEGRGLAVSPTEVFWMARGVPDRAVVPVGDEAIIEAVPRQGGAVRVVASGATWGDRLRFQGGDLFWYTLPSDPSQKTSIQTAPAAGGPVQTLISSTTTNYLLGGADASRVYVSTRGEPTGDFIGAIPRNGSGPVVRLASITSIADFTVTPGAVIWADASGQDRPIERTDLVSGQTQRVGTWPSILYWIGADSVGGYAMGTACTTDEEAEATDCTSTLQDLRGHVLASAHSPAIGLAMDDTWIYWSILPYVRGSSGTPGIYRVHR